MIGFFFLYMGFVFADFEFSIFLVTFDLIRKFGIVIDVVLCCVKIVLIQVYYGKLQ